MKAKHLIGIIIAILFVDQALKFYIKLNYHIGEEHLVLGTWFRLHFVENEGMAWGWKFGGGFGKIALTLFRLVAVILGVFLMIYALLIDKPLIKKIFLILFSLYFYYKSSGPYLIICILMIVIDFNVALLIEKIQKRIFRNQKIK